MRNGRTVTQQLAEWGNELTIEDIPQAVLEKAKLHMLDTLGCAIGALSTDVGESLLESSKGLLFQGPTTGIGLGRKLSVERAAFVNGVLSHTLDFDDTHSTSSCHVSAVVFPAVLAAAEFEGLSGADVLVAFISGAEAIARIGSIVPGAFHRRGLHPTSILGTFGATLAVARLARMTSATTANALGIAGSFSSGTFAYLSNGSNVKPVHAGNAARAGVEAANLARHGFTGPMEIIEGRDGIYGAFLAIDDLDLSVTDSLGSDWETLDLSIKAYPSCLATHSAIQASIGLRAEHQFKGADVVRVQALVRERDVPLVVEPLDRRKAPQTTADARFSLPYTVATALSRGAVENSHFTMTESADAEVSRIASSFDYAVHPFEGGDSQFSGGVRLTLSDGRTFERAILDHPGSVENPLEASAVQDKFFRNTQHVIGGEMADELVSIMNDLESLSDVLALTQLLGEIPRES